MTESSSKVVSLPLPSDDPMQLKPDIILAKDCLQGWSPAIALKDGLRETIE